MGKNRRSRKHVSGQRKAEVGKRYLNINTKKICTVTWKCFFNVGYKIENGIRSFIHYKTFKKNWREVPLKWQKCGLDCRKIGGSQWLDCMCKKENRVDEE